MSNFNRNSILWIVFTTGLFGVLNSASLVVEETRLYKNGDVVFTCNFDVDQCGGIPSPEFIDSPLSNIYGIRESMITDEFLETSLSDYTSISQAAENGQMCDIPYQIDSQDHYHCQYQSLVCKTKNGNFSKCAKGSFLITRSPTLTRPINNTFTFPRLSPGPGEYELEFRLFYFCDGSSQQCQSVNEYITVTVNNVRYKYDYPVLVDNPTWIPKSVRHNISTDPVTTLNVIVEFTRETGAFSLVSLLAFDNLIITRISSPTTTTTTTTTKTTTVTNTTETESITTTTTTTVTNTTETESITTTITTTTLPESFTSSTTTIENTYLTSTPKIGSNFPDWAIGVLIGGILIIVLIPVAVFIYKYIKNSSKIHFEKKEPSNHNSDSPSQAS